MKNNKWRIPWQQPVRGPLRVGIFMDEDLQEECSWEGYERQGVNMIRDWHLSPEPSRYLINDNNVVFLDCTEVIVSHIGIFSKDTDALELKGPIEEPKRLPLGGLFYFPRGSIRVELMEDSE